MYELYIFIFKTFKLFVENVRTLSKIVLRLYSVLYARFFSNVKTT